MAAQPAFDELPPRAQAALVTFAAELEQAVHEQLFDLARRHSGAGHPPTGGTSMTPIGFNCDDCKAHNHCQQCRGCCTGNGNETQ